MRRPKLLPCGEHYPFHACGACAGLPRLRAMEERAAGPITALVVVDDARRPIGVLHLHDCLKAG